MRETSKHLAYANLKDQLVVLKKAKGTSFVERTMKELLQKWDLDKYEYAFVNSDFMLL